jgi:hypothetical protein
MPNGPYGSGNEDFLEFTSGPVRFRLQRLGMYLLSDLFTARYMAASGFAHGKVLATMARGKEVVYTGEILDQWDLDLLVHCAMKTSLAPGKSRQVRLDPQEFLAVHGLRNDVRNRERVFGSLVRMHTGGIEIAGADYTYMTRLLNRVLVDRGRRFCLLEANVDLVASLRREAHIAMDVGDRMILGKNGMAKWLHGMLMVFRGGFSAHLSGLSRLCGLSGLGDCDFIERMVTALELLAEAGLVDQWTLGRGMVRVKARSALSQEAVCGYVCNAAHA